MQACVLAMIALLSNDSEARVWNCEVFPLGEKVKVVDLFRVENKSHIEVAKMDGKDKFLCEIVKKKKKQPRMVFLSHLKLQKSHPAPLRPQPPHPTPSAWFS